ncbi:MULTISPECIES: glycosyltransferase family 2 protein [Cyanophyceae]|uniref:glycosyltransferase family 2 protein n=1 Tax=Cyanophyceae TaxID=3028117 RepID=UPI001688240F|nr:MULTISPECIES: glycosyltransferase family 2 protein [Cyanophyceae]MBD1915399.1 glycosyltransferase [Phormidium sp. FACHB-77]MBD2032400.1 glycosyltransferase [Phormidium sp. FACHB-322]MBD2052571.1 glycosyltransferase [Leptolyngbya sp. FACHB-60]
MNVTLGDLVTVMLAVLPLLLLATSTFFALECLMALSSAQSSANSSTLPADLSLAVLVPAHNEAEGIAATLATILPQLRPSDRLLVIADNCTDATADAARQAGATVIERQNLTQRGKGYALDFGISHLTANPPDIVVFVDADCDLQPHSLAALAIQAWHSQRPAQAVYLMEKPPISGLKDGISAFAFKVKNWVRPLGLYRLGQPCLLTGTGIAMPWEAAIAVNIASGHIVEDMKLGLDLALAGYGPQFCQSAWVTSRLPSGNQAATTQRTRWEHGHLQMLSEYVPKLLGQALRQGRVDVLVLALELGVLPISLQVMVTLAIAALCLAAALVGLSWLPAYLALGAVLTLSTGVSLAWVGYGRSDLSLKDLLTVPLYVLNKIPLYFKFLVKPEKNWVRTERDG